MRAFSRESRTAVACWVLTVTLFLSVLSYWSLRVLWLFLYGHPFIANLVAALVLLAAAMFAMRLGPSMPGRAVAHGTLFLALLATLLVFFLYPDLRDDYGLPNLVRPFLYSFWVVAVLSYGLAFLMDRVAMRDSV